MHTPAATIDSTAQRAPVISQYASQAFTPLAKKTSIPNLGMPRPASALSLPTPTQITPPRSTQDIELLSRSSSTRSTGSTPGGSPGADDDDDQLINDGTATESGDGQVIDDEDEEECGESDSEEPIAKTDATNATPSQPDATKAVPPGFNPATFSGVRMVPGAEITVDTYLASGAFGKVYRGRWNNEDVALKHIDIAEVAKTMEMSEKDLVESFEWEVSRMSTASHPGVVQFHGVCVKDGQTYLVMEFCHQGSMQDVLEKSGAYNRVPNSRLWQWMLEIAQGLAYLHSQGMVHRDLKAANVLIDQYSRAKLADLGVAQVDSLVQTNEATPVAQGLQDMRFIAPENLKSREHQLISTKATDVYALGLVFWQMVTGCDKDPATWGELKAWDEGKAALEGKRESIPEDCPAPIRDLILSCWRCDENKRPTIDQLIQALHKMAPEMNKADHGPLLLAEHMEQALHGSQDEIRNQMPPLVTRRPVEGSYTAYWKAQAKDKASTTTTTSTATATSTTTTTTTATSTTTTTTTTTAPKRADTKTTPRLDTANSPLDLQQTLDDFIDEAGPNSLLLLGEGGMGKSLSVRALASRIQQQWWAHFADPQKHPRPACLLLDLRSHVKSWTHAKLKNACAELLERYGLKNTDTKLLVLVDGYDEIKLEGEPGNLATHLGMQKDAKLLITCRPDTVERDQWKQTFSFGDTLQTRHCLPFNITQMLDYLKQRLGWDKSTHAGYKAKLKSSPELRSVLGNPFMLYLLSQSWETVSEKPLEELTRSDVYAGFIKHMIKAGSGFLEKSVHEQLQGEHPDLEASFNAFAQGIAFRVWRGESISPSQLEADTEDMRWAQTTKLVRQEARQRYQEREARLQEVGEDSKAKHKRRMVLTEDDFVQMKSQAVSRFVDTMPLRPRADSWEFIHKSVWEYCVAQVLVRLCGSEAEAIDEKELRELLKRDVDHSPEILMFLREALQAASQDPRSVREKPSRALDRHRRLNEAELRDAIGTVLRHREKLVQAMEFHQKALELRTSVSDVDNTALLISHNNIACTQYSQGDYQGSLDSDLKMLEMRKAEMGQAYENPDTAILHNNIAAVLDQLGRGEEAVEHIQAARPTFEKHFGEKDPRTCQLYLDISHKLGEAGDFVRAHQYLDRALNAELPPDLKRPFLAKVHHSRGHLFRQQRKYNEAMKEFQLSLELREAHWGQEHSSCALSHFEIGVTLAATGDLDSALERLGIALKIKESVLGPKHAALASICVSLASVHAEKGEFADALELYERALKINKSTFGSIHLDVANIHSYIGTVLFRQKKFDEALRYYTTALGIFVKLRSLNHTSLATCHDDIGSTLLELGRHTEALKHLKAARVVLLQCGRVEEAFEFASRIEEIEDDLPSVTPPGNSEKHAPRASTALAAAQDTMAKQVEKSKAPTIASPPEREFEDSESTSQTESRSKDCLKVCALV